MAKKDKEIETLTDKINMMQSNETNLRKLINDLNIKSLSQDNKIKILNQILNSQKQNITHNNIKLSGLQQKIEKETPTDTVEQPPNEDKTNDNITKCPDPTANKATETKNKEQDQSTNNSSPIYTFRHPTVSHPLMKRIEKKRTEKNITQKTLYYVIPMSSI